MDAEKMIKVKPLDWEEAWALFQKKVGDIDLDIVPLAQDIAKECRGLPIALITISRAMASRNTRKNGSMLWSANGGKVEIEAEEQWWKDVKWDDDSAKTTFLPRFVPYHGHYGF
ncbi:hypothetical protein GH714_028382 [Hevea brasiliensis]|uniref:Uncharacterized protein n=1 Tax=Hevea brasiliensis TaxID=3981 RepID=A0A6A6LM75_HEVBR|nr:hypothetical protein GH714_028382 [Hevea brasiliensis]